MTLVRDGSVREVLLTLEAEGLVESLFNVWVDVMERFMLEVPLTFFYIFIGRDLVGVVTFCSVLDLLLLLRGLVVAQGWTLLVGHAHH